MMSTPPSSAARNIVAGAATRYCLLALNIGIGLFLMPFTVAHLGKAQYGLWMLVASFTYYFALLDLGYDSGLVRHIVEADSRGDTHGVNRIVSTFVCVYSAIGLAAVAITIVLALAVVQHFPHLSPADIATARAILAILGLRVAIGFPMTVFGAVTTARQGFALNNSIAMVMVVLNALVTYVVLTAGGGLVWLVFCTTAVSTTGYVGYAWTARRVFPQLTIRPSYFSRALWRDVTTFSLYLFVIDIASLVTFNVDTVLVGWFLGTSAVAAYAVAVRLSEYERRVCDQFSGMVFPVAVSLGAGGNTDRLRAVLVEGTRIAVVLITGVTICLVAFSRPLITRWMGAGFADSVPSFIVLAMVGVVMVGHGSQSSVLLALGKHRLVATVWTIEAAANFVLSLLLVRRFGAVGVALGTAIPIAIGHVGVLTPAACRLVKVPLSRYVMDTLRPAVIGGVPTALLCVAMQSIRPPATTRGVLLELSGAGLFYLVVVCAFGLTAETRRRYVLEGAGLAKSFAYLRIRVKPATL
jgi:O-antigen/teichoic acid export membrane protein